MRSVEGCIGKQRERRRLLTPNEDIDNTMANMMAHKKILLLGPFLLVESTILAVLTFHNFVKTHKIKV